MTEQQEQALVKRYDDLQIQAGMFEMDIDVETLTLVPKRTDYPPIWAQRWREKQYESDRQPQDYEGGGR